LAGDVGRTIGVLTSGGDCSGLNAVIRAVVHRAIHGHGWRVLGILDGTLGLLERPLRTDELDLKLFTGNILRLGGTILGTHNRGDPFDFPIPGGGTEDRSQRFIDGYRELGLGGLIGIGGDGSLKILDRLARQGEFALIGIPKTIDNDVPLTEQAVGFSTAVGAAVEALDRLQPTAASHDRVMVLEVMGRGAGHIALYAGIAGGADVILIPENFYSMDRVGEQILQLRARGRKHALVVVAEAALEAGAAAPGPDASGGAGHALGARIARVTGAETRVTVLGHVQRGGVPDVLDRVTASAFGVRAVDLLAAGASGRMVAWQHRQVVDVPLAEVNARQRPVGLDDTLVATARGLGICLGD
jgi:6-phosphofructokinase